MEKVKRWIEEREIATIDLKYADLIGNWCRTLNGTYLDANQQGMTIRGKVAR